MCIIFYKNIFWLILENFFPLDRFFRFDMMYLQKRRKDFLAFKVRHGGRSNDFRKDENGKMHFG